MTTHTQEPLMNTTVELNAILPTPKFGRFVIYSQEVRPDSEQTESTTGEA